jgi:hypothetical protein
VTAGIRALAGIDAQQAVAGQERHVTAAVAARVEQQAVVRALHGQRRQRTGRRSPPPPARPSPSMLRAGTKRTQRNGATVELREQ